jgi:hypothetical protein
MAALLVLVLAGAFIAICLSAKSALFGLTFSPEIKPVELAALLFNIGIAVYLQFFFVRRMSNHRVEKDLLIDLLRGLLTDVHGVRRAFSDAFSAQHPASTAIPAMVHHLKILSSRIAELDYSLSQSHAKGVCAMLPPLKDLALDLKRISTGGPPSEPIDRGQDYRHEEASRKMREYVTKLIFEINRKA